MFFLGNNPNACNLCGATFGDEFGLRDHIDSIHSDEPKHKCDECEKTFSRKSILSQHMLKHQVIKVHDMF
jgi:uncharacterized Zn-finger protein